MSIPTICTKETKLLYTSAGNTAAQLFTALDSERVHAVI